MLYNEIVPYGTDWGVNMRKNEIKVIKECFLFNGVEEEIVNQVINERMELVEFEKGKVVYGNGKLKNYIGIIVKGNVEVFRDKILMNKLCEGGVFGIAAIFRDGQEYVSTIVASSKCKIAFLDDKSLQVLFSACPTFAVNYIKFLSDRVAFLNKRIDSFTAPDAESSLARFICQNAAEPNGIQREIGVKNYSEVAQRLNIGRASLYRAFESLEDEGLISKDGKTLKIRNFELLMKRGKLK